jgi:catechol 2,3-dioxygenase-like lactoylglutathione lyase family enzyme
MTRYVLHHVQLAVPPGSEPAARAFYVGLLGMEEVPKPATLAPRGGLWLALEGTELHLGVEADFRPAAKAHPAFEVDDLDRLRDRLARAGVVTRDDDLLPGRRRFYAQDPFGNRLEFVGPERA